MKTSYLFFVFTLVFLTTNVSGQGIVGEWNDYLPLNKGKYVIDGGDRVYLICSGGAFFIDNETNSIKIISAIHDLKDVGINAAAYSDDLNTLILGFEDGLVVFYKDDVVYKMTDIVEKSTTASKLINSIFIDGSYAYLATGFGVVKINIYKKEVSETYPISSSSEVLSINDVIVHDNKIWAMSESSVYCADVNNPNLIDYNSWKDTLGVEDKQTFISMTNYGDQLIIGGIYSGGLIFLKKFNSETILTQVLSSLRLEKLRSFNNNLFIIKSNGIDILNSNFEVVKSIESYIQENENINSIEPNDIISINSNYIIADFNHGMVTVDNSYKKFIYPNRSISERMFDIDIQNNDVIISTGEFSQDIATPELQIKRDGNWIPIDDINYNGNQILNGISVKFLPEIDTVFYLSSWGKGLYRFSEDNLNKTYNSSNSPIKRYGDYRSEWISGLNFDKDKNLWMLNSLSPTPLLAKSEGDDWFTFDYPGLTYSSNGATSEFLIDMMIDSRGYKWIIISHNGLFVVNDNGTIDDDTDDLYRGPRSKASDNDSRNFGALPIKDKNGTIFNSNINAIAEDKDGTVWIGNDEGIVRLSNPSRLFEYSDINFEQVFIPRNEIQSDGKRLADILLKDIKVTSIAVDGANRKWIGTETSGLFLVSEDGTKTIHEFNVDNSPLLSNTITKIGIDQHSGEVYIGTNKGILSYNGNAVEGFKQYTNVHAYPNPVPPNYYGDIVIKGLVSESIVKIMDLSGNLVHETESLGGQAVWDGTNIHGERVSSGVYLVLVNTSDGVLSEVGKIVMIKGK